MSGELTGYTLKHPIRRTFNAGADNERVEEIAELQIRRLKGKHIRAFGKRESEEDGVLILIAGSAGLSKAEADELDVEDMEELGKVIEENFMPPGLRMGKTPSET